MITTRTQEKYDGSWRIVLYDADAEGRCTSALTLSNFDDDIASYYVQRELELTRLTERLFGGEISPIGFFVELSRMTVEDVAARLRLRKGAVRAHLTPKGFDKIQVRTLRLYARLFDIPVADFFQFTHLDGDLGVEVTRAADGVLARLRVFPRAPGGEPAR